MVPALHDTTRRAHTQVYVQIRNHCSKKKKKTTIEVLAAVSNCSTPRVNRHQRSAMRVHKLYMQCDRVEEEEKEIAPQEVQYRHALMGVCHGVKG